MAGEQPIANSPKNAGENTIGTGGVCYRYWGRILSVAVENTIGFNGALIEEAAKNGRVKYGIIISNSGVLAGIGAEAGGAELS
jgi:hypothetical protein